MRLTNIVIAATLIASPIGFGTPREQGIAHLRAAASEAHVLGLKPREVDLDVVDGALWTVAHLQARIGDFDECMNTLGWAKETSLLLRPHNKGNVESYADAILIEAHVNHNDLAKAKALAERRGHYTYSITVAMALARRGEAKEAETIAAALKDDPYGPRDIWPLLAFSYAERADSEGVARALSKTAGLTVNEMSIYAPIKVQAEIGQFEEAKKNAKLYLREEMWLDLFVNIAKREALAGKLKEALADIKIVPLDPKVFLHSYIMRGYFEVMARCDRMDAIWAYLASAPERVRSDCAMNAVTAIAWAKDLDAAEKFAAEVATKYPPIFERPAALQFLRRDVQMETEAKKGNFNPKLEALKSGRSYTRFTEIQKIAIEYSDPADPNKLFEWGKDLPDPTDRIAVRIGLAIKLLGLPKSLYSQIGRP